MPETGTTPDKRVPRRSSLPLPPGPLASFGLALLAVVLIALFSFRALQTSHQAADSVSESNDIIEQLQTLLSTLKDAETGQRGYLLTSEDSYLAPFQDAKAAVPTEIRRLRELTATRPEQQRRLDSLEELITQKLAELDQTVALNRSGDAKGALAVVRSDVGKDLMDRIRAQIADIQRAARELLTTRETEWVGATQATYVVTGTGSALLILLIFSAAAMSSRDFRARETQAWLRTGQMTFSATVQGEQRLDVLGEQVLSFLADYLDAQVGALYLSESHSRLQRFAGYAIPTEQLRDTIHPGEGLLGEAAREKRALHVREVPEGYLTVASSLGRSKVRELLVVPAIVDGSVQGVVELGFLHPTEPADLEFLQRISESLGVAVRASRDRTRLEELLAETQRQAEELQTQQEELRVSNEELEVQTRALKDSQVRLESQQAELEQTNSQLEEQAQLLEAQQDELAWAQTVLAEKAAELEKTNQYKSEFLANVSHELRTPLNSTLILAKLLADNKGGNLTEEQVKFAQTISSAGRELLTLINDILDLSRIEAGRLDVNSEIVPIARVVESHLHSFEAVAREKGLRYTAAVAQGTPDTIETDPARLGQILKNLISNAIKFTDRGEVALLVEATRDGCYITFAVRDTGIGIPVQQQAMIFEAFRQADGSTHRKYGGSGLGLSISRDLARLLGGEVTVASAPGEGSTFTLTLPPAYTGGKQVSLERTGEVPLLCVPVQMSRLTGAAARAPTRMAVPVAAARAPQALRRCGRSRSRTTAITSRATPDSY